MKLRPAAYGLISLCLLLLSSCILFVKDRDRGEFIAVGEEAVSVKFEEYRGLILLEAKVNGQPGKFLLDNGVTLSALNPHFAE